MKSKRRLGIVLVMGLSFCASGLIVTGPARPAPSAKMVSQASGNAQNADKNVPAPTPPAKIQFHAARAAWYGNFGGRPGDLRFEPFHPIDWKRLARRDLRGFNLDHPTPQQLEPFKLDNLPDDEVGLDEYIFVKWKPDRTSPRCSRLYSLLKPGKNLLQVEDSVSGCEID